MKSMIYNNLMQGYIILTGSESFWRCNYLRFHNDRHRNKGRVLMVSREHDKRMALLKVRLRLMRERDFR